MNCHLLSESLVPETSTYPDRSCLRTECRFLLVLWNLDVRDRTLAQVGGVITVASNAWGQCTGGGLRCVVRVCQRAVVF